MNKKLLIDYLPFRYDNNRIMESVSNGRFVVEGILQRAESPNQNQRVYPKPILEREIKNYQQTKILEKRALGELDHPESSVVNLRNVSHNVLHVEWRGNDVWGKVEILNTPAGNILKELFRAGITLGISSRGLGSVKQLDETTVEVQPDFSLVAWDFVSDPSTHGAFMNRVNESIQENNQIDHQHQAHKLIRDIICEISGVCCIQ